MSDWEGWIGENKKLLAQSLFNETELFNTKVLSLRAQYPPPAQRGSLLVGLLFDVVKIACIATFVFGDNSESGAGNLLAQVRGLGELWGETALVEACVAALADILGEASEAPVDLPKPQSANARPPQPQTRVGRPPWPHWDTFWAKVVAIANTPDGLPERDALQRQMVDWCAEEWDDRAPGESTIRDKLAGLYRRQK